ncbi:conserved hypothetical protein [Ricinus communis]|uniref:Uncharacterized protein n=1 Tax=Ricinus communis TaxID=3988 RepID=B9RV83_RICCO|nr:conserved hypothetical protein [Ricinus communis]
MSGGQKVPTMISRLDRTLINDRVSLDRDISADESSLVSFTSTRSEEKASAALCSPFSWEASGVQQFILLSYYKYWKS